MNVPQMRSIKAAHAEIIKLDPESAVSEHMIREAVLSNKVAHVNAGRRILLNFDSLLSYLTNPVLQVDKPEVGTIRPIRA